ncbi:MAG: hypothetical protein JKY95_11615 [Planctomycetaceae bacterium]|nr:hypothetical protein [Planctomycetaceae bacterium]
MFASVDFATRFESAKQNLENGRNDFTSNSPKPAEKMVSWIKEDVTSERRSRQRIRASFEVEINPLDEKLESTGESQSGMILDYSDEGVHLQHGLLIPEQYVSISWADSHQKKHIAIVHLKWCRSTDDQKILSGGRVCSMETI